MCWYQQVVSIHPNRVYETQCYANSTGKWRAQKTAMRPYINRRSGEIREGSLFIDELPTSSCVHTTALPGLGGSTFFANGYQLVAIGAVFSF